MGQAQSEFGASSISSAHPQNGSMKEERPGTLVLSSTEIPSSRPVSMTGSASDRSLLLSQSMPHVSNPSTTTASNASSPASSASSSVPGTSDSITEQTSIHFPQRRRNGTGRSSKLSKLNMKRSGSHPNSLSGFVKSLPQGSTGSCLVLNNNNSNIERPKSPEKRSTFDDFPPKAHADSRKISFAICEEDSDALAAETESTDAHTSTADGLMKAEKQLEEKVEKCTDIQTKRMYEIPELQMKTEDQNSQMDTSPSPSSSCTPSSTIVQQSIPSLCVASVTAASESAPCLSDYCHLYSSERLLYFFDWDDTLLCSSYLRHLNYSLHSEFDEMDEEFRHSLQQLDSAISNVLAALFNNVTKNVFIITNSETGWVERSAMKFLSKTYAFFTEVNFFPNILSARDIYCRTVPEAASRYAQCLKNLQSNNSFFQANNTAHINAAMSQPLQWKEFVFEKTIKDWLKEHERQISKDCNAMKIADQTLSSEKKASTPIHVVCMGDTVERTAIINALSSLAALSRAPVTLFPTAHNGNTNATVPDGSDSQPVYGPTVDEAFEICRLLSEKNMILKSIKFPERPHVTQLEKQINLIGSVLQYLSTHPQPLDLYLSLAVMNNNNNSSTNSGGAATNSANTAQKPSSTPAKSESSNSCPMKEDMSSASPTTEVAA